VKLAARLEDQVVLRVQPDQVDFIRKASPAGGEDVGQHAGVEEEGRPHVEAVAARRLDGR
jgi:hypothetical protein